MCGTVAATFIVGETPYSDSDPDESGAVTRSYLGHGIGHPEYTTMLAGGDGDARHSKILWLGCVFAVLQTIFFVSLLVFGMRKSGDPGPALIPMIVCGAIFAGIFTMLFVSYRGYMNETDSNLFLALPKPTAWMIYGVWFFPVSFVFIYRRYFNTWFLTDDDMDRYKAIVAERQTAGNDGA